MQIELSENALRFLNKILPTATFRAMDSEFLVDAQAMVELLTAIKPKETKADAPSDIQS